MQPEYLKHKQFSSQQFSLDRKTQIVLIANPKFLIKLAYYL